MCYTHQSLRGLGLIFHILLAAPCVRKYSVTVSLKLFQTRKSRHPKKHVFHIPHVVLDEIWGVNKIRKLYLESYTDKQLCTQLGWFRFPKILKFTWDNAFSNNTWPVHWEKAKTFKKICPRVVAGPFSFITNSCIHQTHVHQIKVPEKMLMLAWILHGKIRKKLVHWTIIFSNWLLMTWFHFLVLEVFFGGGSGH